MKFLAYILWVFSVPIACILGMGAYWHWSGCPQGILISLLIDILIVSVPQFFWSQICWAPIPRSAYLGGLIGAHVFLLWTAYSTTLGFLHHKYAHGTVYLMTELYYVPDSPKAILAGALLGRAAGKFMPVRKAA